MFSTENETKTSIPRDFVFESWEDETLNLKPQLLRGLYAFGFDTPSPIQKKGIVPMIRTNKDGKIAKEQDFFDVMSMVNQLTVGDVNADANIMK